MSAEAEDELLDADEVSLPAIEVIPYHYSLRCIFTGNKERVVSVEIVGRHWSEDGEKIWFMLDSHNFYSAAPEEAMRVVPYRPSYHRPEDRERIVREDAEKMARRPFIKICHHCGAKSTTHIPYVRKVP